MEIEIPILLDQDDKLDFYYNLEFVKVINSRENLRLQLSMRALNKRAAYIAFRRRWLLASRILAPAAKFTDK